MAVPFVTLVLFLATMLRATNPTLGSVIAGSRSE
jgi:hypothetical protein